jgi:RES domain-containing protein
LTPGVAADGRYWRILSPRWAHAPLSGEGAARHGGRWNRPGDAALYLSAEIETAFAEYQQEFGVRPGTFAAFDVKGATVADLGDNETLQALGVGPADLLCPWKQIAFVNKGTPPTWLICDRLRADVDGLRVPSAQYVGGFNLVLWRWNTDGAPSVGVHDPRGELP